MEYPVGESHGVFIYDVYAGWTSGLIWGGDNPCLAPAQATHMATLEVNPLPVSVKGASSTYNHVGIG